MKSWNIVLSGMILLAALAFTAGTAQAQSDIQASTATTVTSDDIEPYEGPIGPENVLYGLKIAFENLDETFTFNESEKLGKKVAHARLRIAEAKAKLKNNDNEAAEKALERYREKIEETEGSVSRFSDSDSGLLNALKMIEKHQNILEQLLASHPNSTGLARAYNNSLKLEEKFKEKIERKRGEKEEDREEIEEKIKVKAEIIGNVTKVKVEVKFLSNNTEKTALAEEILNKLKLGRENISDLLEIEEEDSVSTPTVTATGTPTATLTATPIATSELKEKLEAKVEVERGITKVEAEFKFLLNTTNTSGIIEGTYQRLTALTIGDILNKLDIKVNEERKESKEKDNRREIDKEREKVRNNERED